MGLFNWLFKKLSPNAVKADTYFRTLTAYSPIFSSWSGALYESELVRSAIDARARHNSKLRVTVSGSAKPKLQTKLRTAPNEFQTWSQFFYRLSTILDMQNTAFILPVLDEYGAVSGVFPALPSMCEIVEYNGRPWLRYTFQSGEKAAIELDRCGVMTKFQYSDDFMGESNRALGPTMELVSIQQQGIEEAVKSSSTYRFMARMNNFANDEDLANERKRFTAKNFGSEASGGGLLLFPNTYTDIRQLETKPYVVDAEQQKLIQTNVYNYFGVNEDVLQNKAYGDTMDAFFNGAIEPFAIQLSEVMTKMLFTETERAYGAEIIINANRLQYMSTTAKVSMAQQLGDRGAIMIDEIRELFNYPPLPNGEGQRAPIRGEYYMVGDEKEGGPNANQE